MLHLELAWMHLFDIRKNCAKRKRSMKIKLRRIDIYKREAGKNIALHAFNYITRYWINSLNIQPISVLSLTDKFSWAIKQTSLGRWTSTTRECHFFNQHPYTYTTGVDMRSYFTTSLFAYIKNLRRFSLNIF